MLDCQLFQLDAGGHHFTNVLLHAASAILLFLVLREMTRTLWPSAFVAGMFAVHPLHVESVAWVAERKDVLSGLFFMLTLWAYVACYVRTPSPIRYLAMMGLFALGLMSKPMLVTLPLILLLLDYWPLKRFGAKGLEFNAAQSKKLLVEKVPLFALSIAIGIVTIFAQSDAISPLQQLSLNHRVANAVMTCLIYIYQTACPANLAVLYPYPVGDVHWPGVIAATGALVIVSVVFFLCRRALPYLLTGWLWYLVMLAPVIGLVQVGNQAHADRYAYLPQIGLCLLLAWGMADLGARLHLRKAMLAGGAVLILAAFAVSAAFQAENWRDGETLWRHTLDCTQNNSIAENNLGWVLAQKSQFAEAVEHFQEALAIDPDYADADNNLGNILFFNHQPAQALIYYQKAAVLEPNNAVIQNDVGLALAQEGDLDEAIAHFQKAVTLDPNNADARHDLSVALSQKSR